MSKKVIKIATRKSPLALWQAYYVRDALLAEHSDLEVELVKMVSKGDKILDVPLSKVGGKGLFVKELEEGLLAGDADIAVHSMKDVPVEFPQGLHLAIICEREDPRDAFVSNQYKQLDDLPQGAVVGTSSLRRQSQLLKYRSDLQIKFLRGNVNTRLKKLDNGDYDAIILASAGLIRLEMKDRISSYLTIEQSLPAMGQGAVGIECRIDDAETQQLIQCLSDKETTIRLTAERALNKRLEGGCQVPIGGFAQLDGEQLSMRAFVGSPNGKQWVEGQIQGDAKDAEKLGIELADDLLSRGAKGDYDAIILASAGLIRLEMKDRISSYLTIEQSLPAMGQGAVGIECRIDDAETQQLIQCLSDKETTIRLTAERALNKRLEGGCQVPIGGFAQLDGEQLSMRAFVGSPNGKQWVEGQIQGDAKDAEKLGIELADDLLSRGAKEILAEVYQQGV